MNNNRRRGGRGSPAYQLATSNGRERTKPGKSILNEGIYTNARVMHASSSLIGCCVSVEVKNGTIFEGLFKTFSPQMEIVLELAHKIRDDNCHCYLPSRGNIVPKMIFKFDDIVLLEALNVDLDFATKDHFTDQSISRLNGPVAEKNLEPWHPDDVGDESLETLDSSATTDGSHNTNGWDADEMLKTNYNKFNLSSDYDPTLSQYTTPLRKQDTAEYREREERAERIAQEIERNTDSLKAMSLENDDEELKYSAVIRTTQNNSNKYVAPHRRCESTISSKTDSVICDTTTTTTTIRNVVVATTNTVVSSNNNNKDDVETTITTTSREAMKPAKDKERVVDALKTFNKNFKLEQTEYKEDKQKVILTPVEIKSNESTNESSESHVTTGEQHKAETPGGEPDQKKDVARRSNLNAMAKEFVPSSMTYLQQQQQQQQSTATPPRPSSVTASPGGHVTPTLTPLAPPNYFGAFPTSMYVSMAQPPARFTAAKRAVVSARPELNQSHQATVMTGPPLMAQTSLASPANYYPGHQTLLPSNVALQPVTYQPLPVLSGSRLMVMPVDHNFQLVSQQTMNTTPTSHPTASPYNQLSSQNTGQHPSTLYGPTASSQPINYAAHLPHTHLAYTPTMGSTQQGSLLINQPPHIQAVAPPMITPMMMNAAGHFQQQQQHNTAGMTSNGQNFVQQQNILYGTQIPHATPSYHNQ